MKTKMTKEQANQIRRILIDAGFDELTFGSNLAELSSITHKRFLANAPSVVATLSKMNYRDKEEQRRVNEFCNSLGDVICTLYELQVVNEQIVQIDVFLNQLANADEFLNHMPNADDITSGNSKE